MKNLPTGFENKQQIAEWARCAIDTVYFIKNHVYIIHGNYGKVRFNLFKFQKSILSLLTQKRFNIILKPRQMGLSWLTAALALWICTFYPLKNVLIISIKGSTAKQFLNKIKFIYKNLPPFLKCGIANGREERGEIGTSSTIEFKNGSRIVSSPTTQDAGRSESVSYLIVDEAAFIRWLDIIWSGLFPTLSTGGGAVLLSTAGEIGNEYYRLWNNAVKCENDFFPIRLFYNDFPGRDEEWYKIQLRNLGRQRCAREVDCNFLQSGNNVFDLIDVRALDECSLSPIKSEMNDELRVYEEPIKNRQYIIGADTATGESDSWQAAVVIERESGKQVAEYRSKQPIEVYANVLAMLGKRYNLAVIGVEKNNMGRAVLVHLALKYPNENIYIQPKGSDVYFIAGVSKGDLGWETTPKTKPIIVQNLAAVIREDKDDCGIVAARTISEFYTYIQDGVHTRALEGYSDDLVMAMAIALEVRRTTLWSPLDLPAG